MLETDTEYPKADIYKRSRLCYNDWKTSETQTAEQKMKYLLEAGRLTETSIFSLPEWLIWCGSMIPGGDGKYYLLFSLWEEKYGFEGWMQHSKIGCAVAEDPMGPYRFQGIVLEGSGIPGAWDRDVVHNPWIIVHDGRFYLFYTGNYGNGDYRDHGRHQRIGLAIAPHPAGPWKRGPEPLLPGRPGMFDATMTTNPSVCRLPDGSYVMIYKCYSLEPPFNGKVVHGIAYGLELCYRELAEALLREPVDIVRTERCEPRIIGGIPEHRLGCLDIEPLAPERHV